MAVTTAVPADKDPFKGLGWLIYGLVALHIAAFIFWVSSAPLGVGTAAKLELHRIWICRHIYLGKCTPASLRRRCGRLSPAIAGRERSHRTKLSVASGALTS